MPIQTPQRTEYLSCPVCENAFEAKTRLPISLGCGHSICRTCLSNLQRKMCPFDQGPIRLELSQLPVNTALILLIDPEADLDQFRTKPTEHITNEDELEAFEVSTRHLEELAMFLRPSSRPQQQQQLSRPMHRKLVTLINCQLLEEEGRARAARAARSLGERSVTELILQHQNPQQLSANLWAAVRARGCQFLGPAMQEEVLNLVLLALEDGSALSRKVLVMFVVQRLEPQFPQASKTSIGHVVQLLYRASCFKVTKRDGDSSLMQLKEEFRTYETLRREHDAQIVQIATEAGLRIAPDQWSSLLYGDTTHKSHMQSIIDKLQTPQSFLQSVQELIIALQRTGDPGNLGALRPQLDFLASLDASPESECPDWPTLTSSLKSVNEVVAGLLTFIEQHHRGGRSVQVGSGSGSGSGSVTPATVGYHHHAGTPQKAHQDITGAAGQLQQNINARYKTSLCRDFATHGSCPRGRNCTFAHSSQEMEAHRAQSRAQQNQQRGKYSMQPPMAQPPQQTAQQVGASYFHTGAPPNQHRHQHSQLPPPLAKRELPPPGDATPGFGTPHHMTPVAQVAPLQRAVAVAAPPPMVYHHAPMAVAPQQQQSGEMYHGDVDPNTLVVNPALVVPSPTFVAQAQMSTTMNGGEHRSNEERFPPRNEDQISAMKTWGGGPPPVGMATKSLSALKSRKEEIIENLEDLVGKEETEKIAHNVIDAVGVQQQRPAFSKFEKSRTPGPACADSATNWGGYSIAEELATSSQLNIESSYSIWTSRSIATLGSTKDSVERSFSAPAPQCGSLSENDILDAETASISISDDGSRIESDHATTPLSICGIMDDFIPFSDTPHISRFGPISRKAGTMLQSASPRQAQAAISDEPTMTAVVRHSKQLARTVPTLAALYHQNGSRTTLQPVAVGVNGEIGYIAVPEMTPTIVAAAPTAPADPTLQHIKQTSVQQQQEQQEQQQRAPSRGHPDLTSTQSAPVPTSQHGALFAESERMKQELELLQMKISNLKYSESSSTLHEPLTSAAQEEQAAKDELSKELRMIESTIRDRECEININHMRVAAAEGVTMGEAAPVTSASAPRYDHGSSPGIVTTATAGLCPKTRGRYAVN